VLWGRYGKRSRSLTQDDELRAMKNCQASLTEASPISWCTNVVALPHDGTATGKHSIPPAIGDGFVWWHCRKLLGLRNSTSIMLCILTRLASSHWHLHLPGYFQKGSTNPSSLPGAPSRRKKVQVQVAVSNAEVFGNAQRTGATPVPVFIRILA